MKNPSAIAAVLLPLALASASAFAAQQTSGQNELQAIQNVKVSFAQAVTAAADATGGAVVRAAFEGGDGQSAYEVAVLKGSDVLTVMVDAETGAVTDGKAADTEEGEAENDQGDID